VFYLALINQFKRLSGLRGEHGGPHIETAYLTVVDKEKRYHYILDPRLSRIVLDDAATYKQDIFLSRIVDINARQPNLGLKWIAYFVRSSPEFTDGDDHKKAKQTLNKIMDFIHSSWANSISPSNTLLLDICQPYKAAKSAEISKEIVRYYLQKVFSLLLGKNVYVADAVLDAPDIFTPTIKLTNNLQRLDKIVADFFSDNAIDPDSLRPETVLAILSFIYMSVRPLSACLTTLFNDLIREKRIKAPEYYQDFKMVPTFYVAREATKSAILSDLLVSQGDKLYLFLYDSTGCPFSRVVIPFGKGKHFCPGVLVSKSIVKEVLALINNDETSEILSSRLMVSTPLANTSNAFLGFAD
jgi:hypothetical protein